MTKSETFCRENSQNIDPDGDIVIPDGWINLANNLVSDLRARGYNFQISEFVSGGDRYPSIGVYLNDFDPSSIEDVEEYDNVFRSIVDRYKNAMFDVCETCGLDILSTDIRCRRCNS
jgi:hypothetical protein